MRQWRQEKASVYNFNIMTICTMRKKNPVLKLKLMGVGLGFTLTKLKLVTLQQRQSIEYDNNNYKIIYIQVGMAKLRVTPIYRNLKYRNSKYRCD